MGESGPSKIVHASCVSLDERAVLICGASGSGKSGLALQLMGFGASLVADDRTVVQNMNGSLIASAPTQLSGLIEGRGVGILQAAASAPCEIRVVVDLDRLETKRFPDKHDVTICGVNVPCLHKIEGAYFPAAILQYLKAGRQDPK